MINLQEILGQIKPFVVGWVREIAAEMLADVTPVQGSYTPTWTGATTNPVLGNGTLVGTYVRIGKRCLLNLVLVAGSTTTYGSGNWSFSLPFAAKNGSVSYLGVAHLRDTGANNYDRIVNIIAGATVLTYFYQLDNATNVNNINSTSPWSWGSGDVMSVQIEYEIE